MGEGGWSLIFERAILLMRTTLISILLQWSLILLLPIRKSRSLRYQKLDRFAIRS